MTGIQNEYLSMMMMDPQMTPRLLLQMFDLKRFLSFALATHPAHTRL